MHSDRPLRIVRQPLRDQVYAELLRRVLRGELSPGANIAEVSLTEELGVSRTPLREALLRLEAHGFVESHPARGFFVAPLLREDAEELYPILWTLEGLALRTAGVPGEDAMAELTRVADQRHRARSPERALELDTRFHERLLDHCPNGRLLAELRRLRHTVRRYEIAYMHTVSEQREANSDHESVLHALGNSDVDAAARRLEEHWQAGLASVLRRLPRGES